jgi:hypothetical protein
VRNAATIVRRPRTELTPELIIDVLRHVARHYFPLLAPDAAPEGRGADAEGTVR